MIATNETDQIDLSNQKLTMVATESHVAVITISQSLVCSIHIRDSIVGRREIRMEQ